MTSLATFRMRSFGDLALGNQTKSFINVSLQRDKVNSSDVISTANNVAVELTLNFR